MNRPSFKRRPSSGANTGFKRRKSNLGGDDFYDSTNISDNFPRQKPGIMSQAYSYGTECGPTTYTVQGLQQTYDDRKETRSLVSETTLDKLRRFRYCNPQTPNGKELSPGPLNLDHGHYSTKWKDSGNKPSHIYNPSLPSAANSPDNHSLPLRNAAGSTLGPGDIGMTVEAKLHDLVQTYSSTRGNSNVSPKFSKYRKRVISGQGSPCSDLTYQDRLDDMSNLSQATEPQGCNSPNSSIINIQENETPEECPEFCDDEMDEAGLMALADSYSRTNPSVGVPETTSALGGRGIDQEHATPSNFAGQPIYIAHSYGGYPEDLDDEYAMDPEYFNYATEARIQDEPYSNTGYWNSMPDCEASNDGEASARQVQDGVRDSAVGQSLQQPFASEFTFSTSPSTSSNQSHEEPEHTITSYFEEHSRVIYSHRSQGEKVIGPSAEAKLQTFPAARSGDQFIPAGNSVCINTSSPTNPRPSQPFLRHTFPSPVRSRSHIQGLSSNTVLCTCFRIGEAFKASSSSPSATESRTTITELYAILVASYYSGNTQYFTFADLFFPNRPPYLTGKWAGGNPDSNILTRQDDRNANDDIGSICRVIGTVGFSGADSKSSNSANVPAQPMKGMTMIVQGIWRADWNDIEYVKGIVEA